MPRSRPASRRCWAPALATLACLTTAAASLDAHADDQRVALRAELGTEYDSNVHRREGTSGAGAAVVGSPLGRAVLGWTATDRLAQGQDVAFSILGAAKVFAVEDARSENVGIVETSGSWRLSLNERTRLGLSGAYYEAIQAGTRTEQQLSGEARDFRSLSPAARLVRTLGDNGTLTLGGGYRWFVYKPSRDYDFEAPVLSAEYLFNRETADGVADWEVAVGAGVELRRFSGARLLRTSADCTTAACTLSLDPAGTRHQDQFSSAHLTVTRTGRVLLGAGYSIQWNRSNSYPESLVRHVGTARFATSLPFDFYLAARAELVYVRYANPVALLGGTSGQAYATIEDENRSHLRAELTRDLGTRLQLVGRYSLYVNPLGGQVTYRRQTATLSLAFSLD